jgi:hypothetical protein
MDVKLGVQHYIKKHSLKKFEDRMLRRIFGERVNNRRLEKTAQ